MTKERRATTRPAGPMRGRLLLVQDDANLATLLKERFEWEEFDVVHTADDDEALRLASTKPPDIVLLDWITERPTGIEVCRRLRRSPVSAALPIIMLSAQGAEADRIRGLEAGADDYITKPFSPRELIARVGAVLRRVRPDLTGEQLAFRDMTLDLAAHKVRRDGQPIPLGPKEFALLRHLMGAPGRVFSRERLLEAVWGRRDIDARTVDVLVRRLRAALNAGGRRNLIRTVRGAGYALDDDG